MKIAFIAAASTPTITIPTVPQQQVATSPSLLDGLLIYVPLLAALGLGPIIAALITRNSQWQIHRDSEEQKKGSESHVRTAEYITDLAKYWQNYLVNNSSLLHLEKDIRYHELIQNLSSFEKDELSRQLDDYRKKLNEFNKFELPKLRTEAKNAVNHDLKMFKEIIQPPADAALKNLLCSDYIRHSKDDVREKLEEPLRAFLAKELARLKNKNQLQ